MLRQGGALIRAAVITLAELLLLGGCLFGAAGQLLWPMAWAVLGVFAVTKAATFVRIQDDRDHSVVSSGPYALIRHPGYAGVLLAHLALPFALGSSWALVPASIGTIFFVARTSREDRTLRDHLAGYREYQARVRWRLLPGVW